MAETSSQTVGRGPVLLCFDGSDDAHRAIEWGSAITGGGPAVVAHVWKPLMSGAFRYGPKIELTDTIRETSPELDSAGERQAAAVAAAGADPARRAGFDPVEAVSEPAAESTAAKLLEIADWTDARVIVAGARGHTAIGGLLGGVSQRLIALSARPVVVVPHARRDA